MTDRDRILLRMYRIGSVSPIDFAAPDVCDDGKPIMRVAARIKDLRDRGYTIRSSRAANGTAIYRMESQPENHGNAASSAGTPEMAAPSVAMTAVQQEAASPAASRVPPSSRDGLLDSTPSTWNPWA
jgi:hypothetical protein